MRVSLSLPLCAMAALSLGIPGKAAAQLLPTLFPEGVPGYDTAQGVTVQSRLRPDFTPLGLRAGAFQALPTLDETIGYDSNVLPGTGHHGSWEVTTAPAVVVGSNWSRDQVGAAVSLQNTQYAALPSQNRTDANVSAGSRIDFGDDQFTLAAAHLSQHEDRGAIDTIVSDRPIGFQVDDFRTSYRMSDDRWSVTPGLEASTWTYGKTTILGLPVTQSYRDRIVARGDVTVRYELAPLRNLLFVIRALGQDYTHMAAAIASTDSRSYQFLAGFDYDQNAVWRWQLLVGGEARQFTAGIYRSQNTLIAEAEATWSPSGMTTVHATVSRDTEDAAQEGVAGLTYTAARLTIDHEYFRDLLLKASAGLQQADYFQGGHQSGFIAGAGATWLINRRAKLSFTYDVSALHGGQPAAPTPASQPLPSQTLATGYTRSLTLLTLHLGF